VEQVLVLRTSDTLGSRDHTRGPSRRLFNWTNASLAILSVAVCFALFGISPDENLASQVIRLRLAFSDRAPAAPTPEPEPYIAPDRARALNAAVPLSSAPLIPAKSFRFTASDESLARARDCLASAAWYEAGDDNIGQQSVVQVILNRVMNPAFPKTVCGVVFQGSERMTGCQFTFACDGSMRRRIPSAAAWARARANAERALTGLVDPTVGLSTHYHTDWVFPRWSNTLTKIARVGTHLFFRFPGQLGQPAAFESPAIGMEPRIGKLALLSPAHTGANDAPFDPSALAVDVPQRALAAPSPATNRELMGNRVSTTDSGGSQFALQLNMQVAWASYAKVARALCGNTARCTVMGWAPDMAPTAMETFHARRGSALFVYRKGSDGAEQALWDCRKFLRPEAQCLPGTALPSLDPKPVIVAERSATPDPRALVTRSSPDRAAGTP
jgi:spore germination cell wall hydrolase CwlJ-like protein